MKNNKNSQKEKLKLITRITAKRSVLCASILSYSLLSCVNLYASDIEIYRDASNGGNSTIMLMVDTSQTMGSPALDILKDYPLCISGKVFGVVGALPIVDVKLTPPAGTEAYCDVIFPKEVLNLLGTVDTLTGTGRNSLLGLQSSLDYMRASCTPFSRLESSAPARSSIVSIDISLGEGYRCYSRLSRIRMAIKDVLDGNTSKGITALSNKTTIGLSVFPAKNGNVVNQKAGMILVPAQTLDDNQRAALKTAINGLVPSADPLGSTLENIIGILNSVLGVDGLNLLTLLNNVLGLIGSLPATVMALLTNPESSTATAYAETGAYLLGKNTRATGERLSEFEVPLARSEIAYKCLSRLNNLDCSEYEKESGSSVRLKSYLIPTDYLRRTDPITPNNGLLGNLLDSILGWISGRTDKRVYRYYMSSDAIYSGYPYRANNVPTNSISDYDNPTSIKNVVKGTPTSQCEAQGILVLTGNIPKIEPTDTLGVQRIMQKSLGKTPTNDLAHFCSSSSATWSNRGTPHATWSCIASYSQALLDNNVNYRTNVEIKTGVAGIGKEFNYLRLEGDNVTGAGTGGSIVNDLLNSVKGLLRAALNLISILADLTPLLNIVDIILPTAPANLLDVENLAYWGRDGKGGWYTEASTGGVAQSILDFSHHITNTKSEPFMGLQTTPADPLTPSQLSNDVYNSIFIPSDQQSWYGNLKKYSVISSSNNENVIRLVDWKDQWSNSLTAEAKDGSTLLKDGMLGQLKTLRPQKTEKSTRKLWINRDCQVQNNQYIFAESKDLKIITPDYLADSNALRCQNNATTKDQYGGYLMNLLGYQVDPQTATGNSLTQSEPLWQLGMALHSTPLKMTQFAKFNADGSIERDDYIAFGSTQGLLHVVDADNGKEKFAFVPNEMLENPEQRKAFSAQRQGTYRNMPYGVDGAWTAYTEYVHGMNDGKVVTSVGQLGSGNNKIQGKQILYGGLRMGGKSYYALDLADLEQPKLKFRIDPENQRIINSTGTTSVTALQYMGQSWSKPTLTSVNWKGQRRLVMFVGGGYDLGYESKDYNPTRSKGAAVYMFDANNGELLWWGGADATNTNTGDKEQSLNIATMQFSVVSRIHVADRDGDGLTDHLYFGDLGGQVWRIDLNPSMSLTNTRFSQRATRILNLHKTDGSSPRFYDAPSFSVYGYEKPLAVVSIASGNRSLPASDPSSGAIYNIFDRDVTRSNLYTIEDNALQSKDLDLTTTGKALGAILTSDTIKDKNIEQVKALIPNGWTVAFDNSRKVMDEMAVVNKNLYASVYDPATASTCSTQVRGETQVHRYCLPFGICEQQLQSGQANNFLAGKGIVALNIGAGSTDAETKLQSRTLIRTGINNMGDMPASKMRRKLVPLKWYENNEE